MRGFVAGLLLVVTACGDKPRVLPDGPPPVDADVDGPLGPVTITITQGSEPREGVRVLFQNADSSLVLSTTTDAAGGASANMDAGGFVTAIDPFLPPQSPGGAPAPSELRTFAGVEPGDELVLHQPGDPVLIGATITAPEDAEISRYQLHTTCGLISDIVPGGLVQPVPSAVGGAITLADCNGTADMMVQGFDRSDILVQGLYRPDVAVSDGTKLDFTADSYTKPIATTVDFTGVPSPVASLFVTQQLATGRGLVFDTGALVTVEQGAARLTTPLPVAAGTVLVTETRLSLRGDGLHHVIQWGPRDDRAVDVGSSLLQDYASRPLFDAATRSARWTIEASGGVADFVVMTARLDQRPSDGTAWTWRIVAPNSVPVLTLPLLSSDFARFNPVADDSIEVLELTTARVSSGYDGVRNGVLASGDLLRGVVSGATGQAAVEELVRGKGAAARAR